MKRIYRFASIAAAATLMVVGGCEEDELEQKAPADAGAISGATENVCPDTVVALSVKAITGATGYVWYRDGEEVAETDLLDLATGTTSYTATTSGAYAVAGKNDVGVGKKSATVTV
ncbi:MAG: hypothetical protein LBB79_04450, partial [Prevotellaceae bacterium]|nr:hypothetical protein [Prevotellaceae bacterium]